PGVGRKLATLKQAPALIRAPLRCSARPMAAGDRACSFAALTLHTLVGALRARAQPLPRPLVLAVPLSHPRQAFGL
ncbi:MAG: hypothetical protein WCO17_11585, partial [Betaproteobacteria bacterium]